MDMAKQGDRWPPRVEPRGGGVCTEHLDVGARQPLAQWSGQAGIHLDGGQAAGPSAEQVGGETGTGAYLQHILPEVAHRLDPGQEVGLQQGRPLGAGQEFEV